MNDQLFEKLQKFRASLNVRFLERQEVIDGVLASIITKQNCFLFGTPGTGKSELVREISRGIQGTKFFGYLLSPTTDPSELFGPVKVSKLLKDEYTRDVEGYLPSADVAFLDELFRGSSAVLNSLLTILNERTFNNGKTVIETPIQSIVAATNSFPQEESLQAFCDRFLFRPTVKCLKNPTSLAMLDEWALGITDRPKLESELCFEDLLELQKEAQKVKVNNEFLDSFRQVFTLLSARGILVSDRRRVQILKFLTGWALVQGCDELIPEHLHGSIEHIVYQTSDDIVQIRECLDQVVPTIEKVLQSIKKAGLGIETEYHAIVSTKVQSFDKSPLEAINKNVSQLRKLYKNNSNLSDRLEKIVEGGQYRMNIQARHAATKLAQQLETRSQSIARSISDYSS